MTRHRSTVRIVKHSLTARSSRRAVQAIALVLTALTPLAASAQTVFSASGATAATITPTVDAFRAALGPLNPNVAGSFGSGRREINWDGVSDAFSAPNNLPGNFFNANSPRGVVFATPGTGFQVSAKAGVAPVEFGDINPLYPGMFAAFSAQRLFTSLGSNVTDVSFFVPGSSTLAGTSAFGAVFSDVDLANTTSITFFDMLNNSLGTFFAPNFAGDETFSFLGVSFAPGIQIGRVRITAGNAVLSPSNPSGDLVVMDDFIYAEPMVAQVVPEPATVLLLAGGLAVMGIVTRRRTR